MERLLEGMASPTMKSRIVAVEDLQVRPCPSRRERTMRPSASVVVFPLFKRPRSSASAERPLSPRGGSRARRTARVALCASHATSVTAGRDPDRRANRADAASDRRDGCVSVGFVRSVARADPPESGFAGSRLARFRRTSQPPRAYALTRATDPFTPHDVRFDGRTTARTYRRTPRRRTSNARRLSTATRRLPCARRLRRR